MLVSINDLAADLSNPDLVVVDCRFNLQRPAAGERLYAERHIPGAFYADLDRDLAGPRTAETGRHPLPDVEDLQKLLSGFGIGPETRVVVYDEGGGALAARLCAGSVMRRSACWMVASLPGVLRDCRSLRNNQPGARAGLLPGPAACRYL